MGRSASVHTRSRLLPAQRCNAVLALLYGDREGVPVGALRGAAGEPDPEGGKVEFCDYAAACRAARSRCDWSD